ncbi:MAG: hypothetical protein DMG35_13235 [Acidobacteria bacterium]|nr:MAG: hypothetical protein AUH86_09000 [Acidobacteria bacterium 13_1_40CM_4_58_4]PYT59894.1 MAG: hypothetical protein DMG35_13235 [Acidobacteriota bacterium]
MNSTITNASSTLEVPAVPSQNESPRCQYRFSNGKRCRFPGLESQSGFCSRHFHPILVALPASPNDSADLSADLLPELSEFSSGVDIRQFLARLLVQVTKGRVGPRRAAVLAYITNQLLHSHRAIKKESDDQPQEIIMDLPRPKRD